MMTLQGLKKRIDRLQDTPGGSLHPDVIDMRHGILGDVLEEIAHGNKSHRELAREALRTLEDL